MSLFSVSDPLIRLEEGVKWQLAERERTETRERASRARRYRELEEEHASRTPAFFAAVERAEEPYQALLLAPEWSRTLAALNIGKGTPVTTVEVPVPILFPRQSFSFGQTVTLRFKIHRMAPWRTVLEVGDTLAPTSVWWTTGRSNPLEEGSPLVSVSDRMSACPTLLNLCDLLQRGRLLPAIQTAYLHRMSRSHLRRIFRAVTSRDDHA